MAFINNYQLGRLLFELLRQRIPKIIEVTNDDIWANPEILLRLI